MVAIRPAITAIKATTTAGQLALICLGRVERYQIVNFTELTIFTYLILKQHISHGKQTHHTQKGQSVNTCQCSNVAVHDPIQRRTYTEENYLMLVKNKIKR